MRPYVPLCVHSNYSFLEGASHPDELVEEAVRLGLPGLALVDRDGVYGIVRGHLAAREHGLSLIVGSTVTVDDGTTIRLLAMDRAGYSSLCRLITRGRRRCPKGESRVSWPEVAEHAAGLIAIWGGAESALAAEASPADVAGVLRESFGDRLYAGVFRHQQAAEVAQERRTRSRAAAWGLTTVACTHTLYHQRARRPLQDVLTCIRHGVALHDAGQLIRPNALHALRTPASLRELFADDLASVDRTLDVAARCTFGMDQLRYRYPSQELPDGRTSMDHLRELTWQGARGRYKGPVPDDVRAQLERELQVIDDLDYPGYFLTMQELVTFCRDQDILCQGRGSAANSAVCYCLGITAVDPVRMGLLFERFISRERAEPPDIDLDIEHARREEVIQHVYATYGRERAAMVANVIRYRARSAVREVGKALGLAETTLDRVARMVSYWTAPDAEGLAALGLDPDVQAHQQLVHLTGEIIDFPRHLSIHPGGFLLGHEPVSDLVPIENASMEARTVIQWDKEDVEDLGLFKVDLLGLGALHQLHLTFDLLQAHHGVALDMATIPHDDPDTYAMIQEGDTVGVFQIESRAQMSMLPRLRPENFYDLVIEVSIVRPGPITGGMVHPYLRRRRGEEPVEYPHPSLRPVLEKTLGVPLFQEQVMKLAVVGADYTPGEADQLRRDMAAWRRSGRIERHRERLVSRMIAKGIEEAFAERVFAQIRGFGEYGFPESHAASFALISYATSYLRCHYPDAFTCAILNAQPMGFYSVATLVHDAQRHGVQIRPVDIVASGWDCTLEALDASGDGDPPGRCRFAVRMGLRLVKGLGARERARLDAAATHEPFRSVGDVARRTGLDERAMSALAEAGAFECFGDDRREALWDVRRAARAAPITLALDDDEPRPTLPALDALTRVAWDYRSADHSPRGHLLGPLRPWMSARGLPSAAEVRGLPDGSSARYAGLVICRQRPGTANGVVFMTLEDETGFVNVVIWERVFQDHAVLGKTEAFLGVSGRIQSHQDVVHLVADTLWKPELPLRALRGRSRDFH